MFAARTRRVSDRIPDAGHGTRSRRPSRHRLCGAAAVVFGGLAFSMGSPPLEAKAETLQKPNGYPTRPLTFVVSTGPGGGVDQMTRALANEIQKSAEAGIQVVNKPGANGMVALAEVMAAPPDGYTFYVATDAYVTAFAAGVTDVEPGEQMVPLCITQVTFTQVYIRNDEDRFSDLAGLVAFAEKNPKNLSIANISHAGGAERILLSQAEEVLGIKFDQISFDNPGERYSSFLGGHTDLLIEQPGDIGQFLKTEQMKPILTFLPERPKNFSEAASIADLAEWSASAADINPLLRYRALWVRGDVPEERRAFMAKACEVAYNSESFQDFNDKRYMNLIQSFYNAEKATDLVSESIETYKDIYKEIGLLKN